MNLSLIAQWAVTFLLGSAWHFFYEKVPLGLVGLIAPVNESVWEHLKLLYFPFLLVTFLCAKDKRKVAGGICLATLVMPFVLLGAFYILDAGFGIMELWIDIVLYFLTLGFGLWLSKHAVGAEKYAGILCTMAFLYGVILILFTFAVPQLPIFIP